MKFKIDPVTNDLRVHRVTFENNNYQAIGYAEIVLHTTGNCQIFSIAWINNILIRDNPLEILKACYKKVCKRMILVDINNQYIEKLEGIFLKDDIVIKQAYTSTNGSAMTLYLIKTDILQKD